MARAFASLIKGAASACAVMALAGCAAAPVADRVVSQARLNAAGLTDQDLRDVEAGNVSAFLARYQAQDVATLSPLQLRFYCDVLIRAALYTEAEACLDQAGRVSALKPDDLAGKRALILLQQGQYERAHLNSEGLRSQGARYVHALSGAFLDQLEGQRTARTEAAAKLARQWRFDPDPGGAFLAVNLYLAAGDFQGALSTLNDSETRLAARHSLTKRANPEPLRVDPFGEFQFGLTEISRVAPASNYGLQLAYAMALEGVGRTDDARAEINALIAAPDVEARPGLLWAAYVLRGRLDEAAGRDADALAAYETAIDALERVRRGIDTEAGRLGFVRDKQEPYRRAVALLAAQGRAGDALEMSERGRARALVDLLQSRDALTTVAVDENAADALRRVEADEGQLAIAVADRNPSTVRRARASLTQSQAVLRAIAPDVANLITVQPYTEAQLRRLIAPGETVVSYAPTPDGFTAFVMTREGVSAVPIARPGLREDAARFGELFTFITAENFQRDAAGVNRARDEVDALAPVLYRDLIAPVRAKFGSGPVTIVPGDELHYVPFNALQGPNGYLIQERSVRVLPSLSVLAVLADKPATGSGALVFGDPLRGDISQLPFAREEAAQIAQRLPGSSLFIGADATEDVFRSLAGDKRILHIAAHARFDPVDPLASQVYLAQGRSHDGNLTVSDLYGLRLSPEVVVLSACETSRSRLYKGDEVVGLIRGFFFAGARTYVGSLWEVNDESTRLLMDKFYEEIAAGADPREALRAAQIHVIETFDSEPYFWAAFQLYGV